jgi:adenosine deaminase
VDEFIRGLPKAELHVHVEGTLEPEMMFAIADRNGMRLPWGSADQVRSAYRFTDLQSFLDVYYQGTAALQTADDFHDLMAAYLERAAADGVRHAEIFFDPQTHLARGIPFATFMAGFERARREAEAVLGISTLLIMCFLRDLTEAEAIATLEASLPFRGSIMAVGLDSGERGNPPDEFSGVFAQARALGLRAVAHAGEEGPPGYVTGALDLLGAERIDHGVACERDEGLVARLVADRIPLTMCPLSNVRLRVFDRMEDHNLKRLLDRGVRVTINSDDPAYFGGYVADNYVAVEGALGLRREDLIAIARNGIEGSFATEERKGVLIRELEEYVAR